MPTYMVIRCRNGSASAFFADDKDLAQEHFDDMWLGWNDFDKIQMYEFYQGSYILIKDVKKGDVL